MIIMTSEQKQHLHNKGASTAASNNGSGNSSGGTNNVAHVSRLLNPTSANATAVANNGWQSDGLHLATPSPTTSPKSGNNSTSNSKVQKLKRLSPKSKTRSGSSRSSISFGTINNIIIGLIVISQIGLFTYLNLHTKLLDVTKESIDIQSAMNLPSDLAAFMASGAERASEYVASEYETLSHSILSSSNNDDDINGFGRGVRGIKVYPPNNKRGRRHQQRSTMETYQPPNLMDELQSQSSQVSSSSSSNKNKMIPYTSILTIMKKPAFIDGSIPITGQYSLTLDHLLNKQAIEILDGTIQDMITGSIIFPHVDLSSLLVEEEEESSTLEGGIDEESDEQQQQEGGEDEDEEGGYSYLNFDPSYQSVVLSSMISKSQSLLFPGDQAILTRRGLKKGKSYNYGKIANQDRAFIANFYLEANKVHVVDKKNEKEDDKNDNDELLDDEDVDLMDNGGQDEQNEGGGFASWLSSLFGGNSKKPQNYQQDNNEEETAAARPLPPSALLMSIFDGHGTRGHEVSHYSALEFARVFCALFRRELKRTPDIFTIQDVNYNNNAQQQQGHHRGRNKKRHQQQPPLGVETDNAISRVLTSTYTNLDVSEPVKGMAGTTASTLFYPGVNSKVYIANAGDSTTILVRYSKSKRRSTIIYQTKKHVPDVKEERERIIKSGGFIMPNMSLGRHLRQEGNKDGGITSGLREGSKLIVTDPSMKSKFGVGEALATSRSIGDAFAKSEGVIAEPEVDVLDIHDYYRHLSQEQRDDSEWFAVMGSDGLFDVLAPQIVVEYLGRTLYHHHHGSDNRRGGRSSSYSKKKKKNKISPLEACERIIREASRLWARAPIDGYDYRDDITLGVSKIDFSL